MASYLHRTATTVYPCYLPVLGDSTGAGRIRLATAKVRIFFCCVQVIPIFDKNFFMETTLDAQNKNNPPSFFGTAVKYGLILFVVLVIHDLAWLALTDNYQSGWKGAVSTVITIAGAFMILSHYKKTYMSNQLTFGEGFKMSWVALIVSSLLTGIYSYILLAFVSPELVDMMIQQQYDEMLESGMQADQAKEAMKFVQMFMKPAVIGVMAGVFGSIFSVIWALIAAAINKTK